MCQVVNFHLEPILSKTKMEKWCSNPLLINIDKSEAVYRVFFFYNGRKGFVLQCKV